MERFSLDVNAPHLGFHDAPRTHHFEFVGRDFLEAPNSHYTGVAEKPEAEGIQRKRGHMAILARRLSNLWPCGFNESVDF